MNNFNPIGVVVNIDAELEYWRAHYPASSFYQRGLCFDDCVAPIKFAYDAYLILHNYPLRILLPVLREKHDNALSGRPHVDWQLTRAVLIAVWERLQAEPVLLEPESMPLAQVS